MCELANLFGSFPRDKFVLFLGQYERGYSLRVQGLPLDIHTPKIYYGKTIEHVFNQALTDASAGSSVVDGIF